MPITIQGRPFGEFVQVGSLGRKMPTAGRQNHRIPLKEVLLVTLPIGWQGSTGAALQAVTGSELWTGRAVLTALSALRDEGRFLAEFTNLGRYGRTTLWRRVA